MALRSTSLLAYIIDYLTEEHQRAIQGDLQEAVELINAEQIRELVNDAIDAYLGGAQ